MTKVFVQQAFFVQLATHTILDPWPLINDCLEQWSERVFLFSWVTLPFNWSGVKMSKQLSTTPLNPNLWQRTCIEILHVKKLWIGLYRDTVLCVTCRDRRVSSAARTCSTSLTPFTPSTCGRHSAGVRFGLRKIFQHSFSSYFTQFT